MHYKNASQYQLLVRKQISQKKEMLGDWKEDDYVSSEKQNKH
jgi:hypothetical protein